MTSPQLKTRKNYEILDPLGHGVSGLVNKIRILEDKKVYALKHVSLEGADQNSAHNDAMMENNLLRKNIPNVLKSIGSHHEPNESYIFTTDLMEMTLQKYINKKGPLTFEDFFLKFKDILRGIIYILFP